MHYLGLNGHAVEVELVTETPIPRMRRAAPMRAALAGDAVPAGSAAVLRTALAHFKAADPTDPKGLPALPLLREQASGTLKTLYREVMVRIAPGASERTVRQLLAARRLEVRREVPWAAGQVVVADKARRRHGMELFDLANELAGLDEIVFATPNFVSQYRRTAPAAALPAIPPAQWHLFDTPPGAEDLRVRDAWTITTGRPSVVVAVLDDGVDLAHPNLRGAIWRNPDRAAPDRHGRDFVVPVDNPDHFDPRPKRFTFPYDVMAGNDIHGTPCAGLIAARGRDAVGVAPRCKVLPVKIFHADDFAPDEAVATAVRYAARHAAVVSCSWTGPDTPDLAAAVADTAADRGGLGAVIVAATGNDEAQTVGTPARTAGVIAVGACTDAGRLARYSNTGPEVCVVAPSSGGKRSIYTTDVGIDGRGFTTAARPAGLHTDTFGGTSAATPLVAGVVALLLSVDPDLDRAAVRDLLQRTAHKIGTGYGRDGHSDRFGHGRVDAAAAVAAARDAAAARRRR